MWQSRTAFLVGPRAIVALVLLVASMVLAGCGGSAAPAGQKAAEPTKAGAASAGSATPAANGQQSSATKEIPIGFIAELTGPFARQGELLKKGAEMAVDEINEQGGIKSLGGAKLVLKIADTGDTPEKGKNAAQRLLSQEKGLVGGTGAWLSSFTLGITEVTERAKLPWVTLSYSDEITNRGFKYVFQVSPTTPVQAKETIPLTLKLGETATGKKLAKVGIVTDNSVGPVSFAKEVRNGAAQYGYEVVVDETFTPPLSEATPMVQKIRNQKPDVVFTAISSMGDIKLFLEKMNEMGLRGQIPLMGNGGSNGTPELLKAVGADLLEGYLSSAAFWPGKQQQALVENFKKRTNEPWVTQDSLGGYGQIWVIKDALEKAGSIDTEKVAEALRTLDVKTGPAAESFTGGHLKFDDKGRRVDCVMPVIQWQKGVPVVVAPTDIALSQPVWPK